MNNRTTGIDIRYHVNEKRLQQIYKDYPKQDRQKTYQIKQDELQAQLEPRLLWDSSTQGTLVKWL